MELDEMNKAQVKRLFMFLRGKRERHLREMEELTTDLKEERCGETIYNQEDVVSLLESFASMVQDLAREHLENLANMTALYTADLLAQAQQVPVQIAADVNSIEDEVRLAKIAELADWQGNMDAPRKFGGLASLNAPPGSDAAAAAKISALTEENQTLNQRYLAMQKQLSEMMKERTALSDELSRVRSNFQNMKSQMGAEMQGSLSVSNMEEQLASTRALLESKSSEIERIRDDMNKRLGDSNQFKELKAIVSKKNIQIKQLRERLKKYEGDDDEGAVIREDD